MWQFTENLINYFQWSVNPSFVFFLIMICSAVFVIFLFSLPLAGLLTFAERKIAGHDD